MTATNTDHFVIVIPVPNTSMFHYLGKHGQRVTWAADAQRFPTRNVALDEVKRQKLDRVSYVAEIA